MTDVGDSVERVEALLVELSAFRTSCQVRISGINIIII